MIDRNEVKIVFMGTPEFAKKSLQKLVENSYNVVACFTNQDKPSGRGMKLKMSPVKEYAMLNNIELYQPQRLKNNEDIINILKDINPDIIVVVAYGKILPKQILDIPKYGCINVHGSLLPEYRGAAPIQWALIDGKKVTGITTMFMDEGMDTGDMLLKKEVEILDSDNCDTMFEKMSIVGADLLLDTLDKVLDGSIRRIKQPEKGSVAPQITREMTKLDFSKNALDLVNLIRGVGNLGTYMEDEDGIRYKVYGAKINDEEVCGSIGQIVIQDKKHLGIKCFDKVLEITQIQAPNSKKMDIVSFLAGNKLNNTKKFI